RIQRDKIPQEGSPINMEIPMKLPRDVALVTAALAAALTLAGAASAQEPQTGGVLRILATGEPDHMDPTSAGMVNTNNYMRAVSRQLVSYAASNDAEVALAPVGDLATEVPQPS